jgi:hypothetical protein
MDESQSD